MIPFLIRLFTGLGVPAKAAKPVLAVIGALLLLGVLWGGKCAYDAHVISTHEAKQDAANAKADRQADAKAAEQRRVDDARITNEATELQRSTEHAQTDLDRRLAFQRCLRMQQAARASNSVVPSCH